MNQQESDLEKAFPLYHLRIKTPLLTLRLMTLEEIASLALRAQSNVIARKNASWLDGTWATEKSPEFEWNFTQYHLTLLGSWDQSNWHLPFGIFPKDSREAIGVLELLAKNFPRMRTVKTGSWILRDQQRKGFGKEARAAALQFAFESLGSRLARSASHKDNLASERVSLALGYKEDGVDGDKNLWLLRASDWQKRDDITVSGFRRGLFLDA